MKRALGLLFVAVLAAAAGYLARGDGAPHQDMPDTAGQPGELWTCGMHPQVIRSEPGFCPICGMALTPLHSDRNSRLLTIAPEVVQNMGVRTAAVTSGPLQRQIRTVAYLAEAQPNQRDVNLRVNGWIERLHADTEGMHLRRGDPLFDLYSPELQVGIQELIVARSAGDSPAATQLRGAAERKLRLLGLSDEQVTAMAKLERAPRTVTFLSPIDGHLIQKMVVEGSAVKAGDRALQIVDHSSLWLDAQVHEQHLPYVRAGQQITAEVEGLPGKVVRGQVQFIHPHVEPMTRTAVVRAVIENPSLELRPGMFANVEITADIAGDTVQVPREAVIDTGVRQVAFVALDGGRFEPRQVVMGAHGDDGRVQILEGLTPGETVVTSGQFLLDAESRFREAIAKFQAEAGDRGPGSGDQGGSASPAHQH